MPDYGTWGENLSKEPDLKRVREALRDAYQVRGPSYTALRNSALSENQSCRPGVF